LDFYTNCQSYGSRILLRGIENGRRVAKRLEYYPTLFVPSRDASEYTTIRGDYVKPIKPGNIKETKLFLETYKDVDGFAIFGNTRFEYTFISDTYPGEVKFDRSLINVANIDIEVASEFGFPEPEQANEEITAITFKMRGKFLVLGCGEFENKRDDVKYIKCDNELHLIKTFLDLWTSDYPDIVTGWYIKSFDIPYLYNRISKLFGEKEAKRLSPWNVVWERVSTDFGREEITYTLMGMAILDELEMFKKFVPDGKSRESHKLGDIAAEELEGFTKLSYEEYGNLHTLYKDNYQLFIEYNIRDVELVDMIDAKHKLIDLVITLAYDNKCNYEDAFQQVRMWDVLTYNKLRTKKQVVPSQSRGIKKEQYVGAFVKAPIPGKYKKVVSLDLDSLYPHLVMQYNISPDKFVYPEDYTDEMRKWLSQNVVSIDNLLHSKLDLSPLKGWGVTLTPNGQFFKIDEPGFLTELMMSMYEDRKVYKKKAGAAKKELINETDPIKIAEIKDRASRNNNLQLAKKVSLNSAYGALGNEFFRFFDVRQAAAITTSGQLAIQWVQNSLNAFLNKTLNTDKDYVIAIDTDSVYLCLEDLVQAAILDDNPDATMKQIIDFMDKVTDEDTGGPIAKLIEKSYNELAQYTNALAQRMHMKRESLADAGIWTGKKRYALSVWDLEGARYNEPVIKVTGLEVVKSTTPKFCRAKLKEAIEIILHKSEKEIWTFIDTTREEFMKLSFNEMACPRGVNGIKSYHTDGAWKSKTPFHVKASISYNRMIDKLELGKKYQKIKDGDKIKYLYLKIPNTVRNRVIAYPTVLPKEFDIERFIDYNHQFELTFLGPLRALLSVIGWNEEKVNKLGSMFVDDEED
jgi:DNA polymerase elongation subunit (family B)